MRAERVRRRRLVRHALALAAAAASCSREKQPRVVAFSPAAAELVAVLAADAHFVDSTGAERSAETVSDSVRAALRTDVDLVIGPAGTAAARSLATASEPARRFPIAVDFEPHSFDEAFAATGEIGAALGRSAAADAWERGLRSELAAISASSLGQPRPRVAVLLQLDPPVLAGGHSFLTELVEIAGAENLTHGTEEREIAIGLPALASANPDLALLVDPPGARVNAAHAAIDSNRSLELREPRLRLEAWNIDPERFWVSGAGVAARALRERVAKLTAVRQTSAASPR